VSEDPANLRMRKYWGLEEVDLPLICHWVRTYAAGRLWQRFQYWRRRLGIPKEARTIEVGCGYGRFSLLLGLTGARVVLMDYNEAAIQSARAIHARLDLHPECLVESLLDPPAHLRGTFDVVCSLGVLEHFVDEHREKAFRMCAALLRPGGLLYFTVPNRYGVFYRLAFKLRHMAGAVPGDFCEIPYSRNELFRLALKLGVKPLEILSVGTFREDFDYWIIPNVASLKRKALRLETPELRRPTEVNTADELRAFIASAPRDKMPGHLGRLFTCNLLFVGTKQGP